jgi:hypothetical protein
MLAGALLGPLLHVTLHRVLVGTRHPYILAALFGIFYATALTVITIVGWYLSDEVTRRPPGKSVAGALTGSSMVLVVWLPLFVGAAFMLVGPLLIIAGAMIGVAAAAAEIRSTR